MSVSAALLVVDDDPAIRKIVSDRLRALGYQTEGAADGEEALRRIEEAEPDLVILDLQMPRKDGFEVLEALAKRATRPAVVVLTAHGSIDAAVRAVKMGAEDLLTKPFEAAHLEHVVRTVLERRGLKQRVAHLETELSERHTFIASANGAMREAHDKALKAAASDATLLFTGESGTGKEVLARAAHLGSRRKTGPFVALNCAVLSAELIESELFGHERGAFTGAVRAKPGKIELASEGTLFLDEIGELALPLQAKLLRVLQEREYERVGGTRVLRADVRIIAATNRDLQAEVTAGHFRSDLFYRLNVVAIRVPALRERPEDVQLLLEHYLARLASASGHAGLSFAAATLAALHHYSWPGNVRELANVVERSVVLSTGPTIELSDLPEEIAQSAPQERVVPNGPPGVEPLLGYHDAVVEAKRGIIREALRRTGGHQTRAADLLGLGQPYLARLMKNLAVR